MLVCVSMACGLVEPALPAPMNATSTARVLQSWSVVEIPKSTPTAFPPASTPLSTVEAAAGEVAPTSTAEERPVITMVIVEDESQTTESSEAPPEANASGKYILVSISEQRLYAYENGQVAFSFTASTGMGNSTRVGSFRVLDKIPNAYGANWNIWMPNWLGIYWSGTLENGIHALPILPGGARLWAGYLGTPISYGCVVLGVDEATQLYEWAVIGTPVEIRW
jgi:lipoprotein-anchoring transpeptidase ErfK/SrfK